MDSSKATLTISEPSEDKEKRKYSLRIDYAAKVSHVMTNIPVSCFLLNHSTGIFPIIYNVKGFIKRKSAMNARNIVQSCRCHFLARYIVPTLVSSLQS